MLNMNRKKLHNEVTWYDYVKPMQTLERYVNNFCYWNKISDKRSGN